MNGRVCQVVSSLRTGGMERMVCDLMGGLTAHGIENVLFCTDAEGELYETAPALAKACGRRKPGLFVIDWRLVCQMVRFVKAQHVTLLHAHNHAPNLYCVLVSLLTGIPVIVTRHGQGHSGFRRVLLTRILSWRARVVVMVSEDAKRVAIKNRSVSKKKATVIHNGVDTRHFMPRETTDHRPQTLDQRVALVVTAVPSGTVPREHMPVRTPATTSRDLRSSFGIPADAVVIGSVGRLSPEKNYTLLVRAFSQLAEKSIEQKEAKETKKKRDLVSAGGGEEKSYSSFPLLPSVQNLNDSRSEVYGPRSEVFLLLIGDGPDRANIEAEITRHNLQDRCFITGMQSDVLPWLHTMDIFCLSSDTEGLSISLLEAGSCALPSVVTDVGGNREVVMDGETGIVVSKREEIALSVALGRLTCDEVLRQRLGGAARRRVMKSFSFATMVERCESLYQ